MTKKKRKTLFEMTFTLNDPLNIGDSIPRINKKSKKRKKNEI